MQLVLENLQNVHVFDSLRVKFLCNNSTKKYNVNFFINLSVNLLWWFFNFNKSSFNRCICEYRQHDTMYICYLRVYFES